MLAMASGGLGVSHVARHHSDSALWRLLDYHTEHVPWVGCSAWDLIQPAFMLMVGVAMAYSYAGRKARGQTWPQMLGHASLRAAILVLLGVFLRSNGRGETNWTFEDVITQIGLGYVFLFLLWDRPARVQWGAALGILAGYWALFAFWPAPGEGYDLAANGAKPGWEHHLDGFGAAWNLNANPAHYFDVWFLNLFPRSEPFKFNSGGYQTLSFIPSLATMIFGLITGEQLRTDRPARRKAMILAVAGCAGLLVGWMLGALGICPVVKRLWTPSWTIYSTGWAVLILSAFYVVIDLWGRRAWAFPGVVVGMNSITIYVMTWVTSGWIVSTLRTHFGAEVFLLFGEAYESMFRRTAVLLVMWLILYWLYRQRIFLRI